MRTGIKPRVNEAREFLEIAKDFKDPREILREAISNSWDANAKKVSLKFDLISIPGLRSKKIVAKIEDNGDGMSSEARHDDAPSEIEGFFNLGDSYKGPNQIGSKCPTRN
jgi:nitrogen fixation/metabolism regulation signal transduction histidine kinase